MWTWRRTILCSEASLCLIAAALMLWLWHPETYDILWWAKIVFVCYAVFDGFAIIACIMRHGENRFVAWRNAVGIIKRLHQV
jgi:hypothetical protein